MRSIVLPLKAIALNVLSIGASFGIVVLIWQEGWASQLIGGVPDRGDRQLGAAGDLRLPLRALDGLRGLHPHPDPRGVRPPGSTDEAVVLGLGRTGRLVTSAALILFLAFVALSSGPSVEIKVFATGLALGIALDATVVRALLVPALVSLLGRANWWLPDGLARGAGWRRHR